MRRKIAVMVCAALMTAMLGACGGSTSASSGQAEAPAETAAEEARSFLLLQSVCLVTQSCPILCDPFFD